MRAIHVRNGERVRKGQLLIELDPTIAGADEAQAGRGLLEARIAEARNAALLAHLRGGQAVFDAPAGTPAAAMRTQQNLIRSSIAEYDAQRAGLIQSRAEAAANLSATESELAKLRETLPLIDQQLAARRDLTQRGHFSKLKLLEYEQLRIEHLRNIDIQQSGAAKGRAAIANIDAQLAQPAGTFGKTAASELATAEGEAGLRSEEVAKSERRRLHQQIVSPVDGIVQQLAVHTVGGVVQPAQALMVIVPESTALVVDAQILNRDIGFVREGQPVRVKVEAFPFTDYGIVNGVVDAISRDAVQEEQRPADPAKASSGGAGLVYKVRIRLRRDYLVIGGRRQPLGPGLAVQAEIKTGQRRIIQYLLSPISKAADEAGRER